MMMALSSSDSLLTTTVNDNATQTMKMTWMSTTMTDNTDDGRRHQLLTLWTVDNCRRQTTTTQL